MVSKCLEKDSMSLVRKKKGFRYIKVLHNFLDYDTFLAHPLRSVTLKAI